MIVLSPPSQSEEFKGWKILVSGDPVESARANRVDRIDVGRLRTLGIIACIENYPPARDAIGFEVGRGFDLVAGTGTGAGVEDDFD